METIVERPAALDVHKAQVTACVRVPGRAAASASSTSRSSPRRCAGLLALRDWLAAHRVEQVVMEATGVYWKAPWAILEDEFECLLVNARHVKQVPGRKTDVSDAAWLCRLAEAGLLKASFVPPKPIRQLRNLTRYRKTQIQERQREVNRLHKALEDAGIKLDCVATDILGKSGRDMLDALVAGHDRPGGARGARAAADAQEDPARCARRSRVTSTPITRSGSARSSRHIDFLDEQIDRLSDAIEEQIRPFAPAVELLCTITGIQRRGAECVIGEIGADMSAFAPPRHLASWAGQCPGNDQSAGKRRSGKTRNGSKWLDYALEEAAMAAIRVRDGYLAAQYRRLKPRRGHKKALGAVKHRLICAIWHMLATGETYRDLGADYFTQPRPRTPDPNASSPSSNASDTTSTLRGGRGSLSELFLPGVCRAFGRLPARRA